MDRWLEHGLNFLSSDSLAVSVAAVLILAGSALAYFFWFIPPTRRLLKSLARLAESLSAPAATWQTAKESARTVAKEFPFMSAAWHETEERVIPLQHGQRTISVMFGSPRDVWSANRLLMRQINVPLVDAVPNLLVGFGLLLTFFFLTLALTQATSALVSQSGEQADLLQATRGLLSAAGAKFLTSLAGLFASIAWAIAARRQMANLNRAADTVLDRLAKLVPTNGSEMAIFAHLQLGRDLHQLGNMHMQVSKDVLDETTEHAGIAEDLLEQSREQTGTFKSIEQLGHDLRQSSNQHVEVSRESLGKTADLVDLTEELLDESREQTGTFKRFETDLAVSLAGAITQAFAPQMETMTLRLVNAIEGLSEKIGTMNQDALQKMLSEFGSMLKQATDSEMEQFRQTLVDLSARLDVAGESISHGATGVVKAIDAAGATLLERVEQVSANLATGATNLEGAADAVKIALNDLDVTISEAARLGKESSAFISGAIEATDATVTRLKDATDGLGNAASALQRVSGQVSDAVDSVEELSREQRAVISAVKEATPSALAAVQRVSNVLELSTRQTADSMTQTKQAMESTAKSLGATVASITEGISEYSDRVAELHRAMDEQMSSAIGSLDKGVVGLEEAIEELGEVLTTAAVRT